MANILEQKRILFFSPAFFGYEQKIKDKMQELGAIVDMFDERAITKAYQKALLKINPNIFNGLTEKYYFDILEQVKGNKYDYVLFVKCDMPTEKVLQTYRETFKDSKFCLHMWDSVQNIPNVECKFTYFDYISSFDRDDCKKYSEIHFRPLFYCDDYKKDLKEDEFYEYDLCFIGTIHSDRYKILKEIREQAEEQGLNIYIYPYLQSRFIYRFYKIVKSEFRDTNINDFKFDKIASKDISKKIDASRVIVDIQHPKQTGLTMRTIEMVGMNKKIITTNADIVNYDFYNENNICVIDRNNVELSVNLKDSYQKPDEELYKKYSLESWIYGVIGYGQ